MAALSRDTNANLTLDDKCHVAGVAYLIEKKVLLQHRNILEQHSRTMA